MKRYFLFSLILVRIITNAQTRLQLPNERNLAIQNSVTDEQILVQENDIIGSWNLELQAFDKNSNGKLDEGERQHGNSGRHFYQFNADGTCLIHTMKLNGYYELKNEGAKRRLYTYVYDKGKPVRENAWYIISVNKTEMILLSQDKYAFWIYKRV